MLTRYREEIRGQLLREFGYSSVMQAPEVKKVVVNVGLGEALTNARAMETTPLHIAAITGQRPVITKARRSVAGFKVREGNAIGVMVTLRGHRMYEFLDRMISMALPRIRDFRGVPRTSFDGKGNYSLGLREQIMFPEIDYGTVDRVRGLQVTITTSAANDPEGFRLLELMGMPFARGRADALMRLKSTTTSPALCQAEGGAQSHEAQPSEEVARWRRRARLRSGSVRRPSRCAP